MMTDALPAVDIRRAGLADAGACAEILNRWIDARDWMPRVHSPEEVAAFYADFVFVKRQVWVAGDPISGFLALDAEGETVTALYVAEPGRGIGRQLLEKAKTDRKWLDVWTFVANEAARRFYEREGFREIQRTDGDHSEEGLPEVKLRWERFRDG